jgi:hypothetical protein
MNSRNKGHSFERDIAKKLRCVFPSARRHLEYHKEDCKGFDLDNTGKFKIQCKRGRNYAPINKIEEPELLEGEAPVLITKGDKKKIVVCMYFEDWIKLL